MNGKTKQVMNRVLDWFQNLMIYHIDNEEDFVEIGRILLSVKRYTVTPAEHQFELQQVKSASCCMQRLTCSRRLSGRRWQPWWKGGRGTL